MDRKPNESCVLSPNLGFAGFIAKLLDLLCGNSPFCPTVVPSTPPCSLCLFSRVLSFRCDHRAPPSLLGSLLVRGMHAKGSRGLFIAEPVVC